MVRGKVSIIYCQKFMQKNILGNHAGTRCSPNSPRVWLV
jgi:hypothetical protein